MQPVAAAVLVIHGDAGVGPVLRDALEAEGCRIQCAGDEPAALTRLATGEISLVLLDCGLPNHDRLEWYRRLRWYARDAALPIVLLGSAAGEAPRVAVGVAGAPAPLDRPFDRDGVQRIIAKHLHLAGRWSDGSRAPGTTLRQIIDCSHEQRMEPDGASTALN